jgi:hypothetical protein
LKKRTVEVVKGGNNSIDSKNTNPNKRAKHIPGGMEHNLAGYAKYYSSGHTKNLRNSESTKEIDHSRKDFFEHW